MPHLSPMSWVVGWGITLFSYSVLVVFFWWYNVGLVFKSEVSELMHVESRVWEW